MSSKVWKPLLTKVRVGKERKQLEVSERMGQAAALGGRNDARLVNKGVNGAGGLEMACALRIGDVDGDVAPIEERKLEGGREKRMVGS